MILQELIKKYDRVTIRAIMQYKDNKYIMCYNKKYDSYTFPGGGVESDETDAKLVLAREVKEETGLDLMKSNFVMTYLCSLLETGCNQLSIFYVITNFDKTEFGNSALEDNEKDEGLTTMIITLMTAYSHNKTKAVFNSVTNRECIAIEKMLAFETNKLKGGK